MKDLQTTLATHECQLLLENVQTGGWKADFAGKYYECSEYVVKLFGLVGSWLTFLQF